MSHKIVKNEILTASCQAHQILSGKNSLCQNSYPSPTQKLSLLHYLGYRRFPLEQERIKWCCGCSEWPANGISSRAMSNLAIRYNAEYYASGDFCRQKYYTPQRLVMIIIPVKTRRIASRLKRSKWRRNLYTEQANIYSLPQYHIVHNGSRHRVCQPFLKTLRLSNRAVLTAVEGRTNSGTLWQMDGCIRQP